MKISGEVNDHQVVMELELLGSIFSRLGEASGRGGEISDYFEKQVLKSGRLYNLVCKNCNSDDKFCRGCLALQGPKIGNRTRFRGKIIFQSGGKDAFLSNGTLHNILILISFVLKLLFERWASWVDHHGKRRGRGDQQLTNHGIWCKTILKVGKC